MTQQNRSSENTGRKGRIPQQALPFYLPDLCSVEALLPLILIGQLFALLFTVIQSPLPVFNWFLFALLSIEILWIVLVGAAALCAVRPWLRQLHASQGGLLCFSILLVVITLIAAMGQWLLVIIGMPDMSGLWSAVQHIAAGGIISGLVLRYFYLQQQLHLQQQLQMEAQMHARFQALQSRIRPHFLFNSMNIIASLIAVDPDTAEKVVEDLSTLFRASLANVDDLVPLSHELDLCQRYSHIEQLRLGNRLRLEWHNTLHRTDHPVPSLCLQPLVENAIYHGIQPRIDGGVIHITLSDDHGRLVVRISNPYDPLPDAPLSVHRGNGMALTNLEQRLLSRYGDASQFSITRDKGTFVVTFSIPCTETAGTHDQVSTH